MPSGPTTSPLLRAARGVVADAAEVLGWSSDRVEDLLEPEAITTVELTVDGLSEPLEGWRVRHSSARGPAKGGVRFTPTVTRDDVTGLATLMSLKTAVTNLPFGGGKGGVAVPAGISPAETSAIARAYGCALVDALDPELDVAAPDMGTSEQTMLDIIEGWAEARGVDPDSVDARSIVTGKPMESGGLDLRTDSTARGLHLAIRHLRRHHDLPDTPRVAIQGYGAVGGRLAEILADQGWKVVAVADSGGTLTDDDGLDVHTVASAKRSAGSVTAAAGLSGPRTDIFHSDCDLLVLAAQEAAIDEATARDIAASVIVEGANAPCTVEGDRVLAERDITVVPDIVANAGGVTGSWLEWEVTRGAPAENLGQRYNAALEAANERMWAEVAGRSIRPRLAAAVLAMSELTA